MFETVNVSYEIIEGTKAVSPGIDDLKWIADSHDSAAVDLVVQKYKIPASASSLSLSLPTFATTLSSGFVNPDALSTSRGGTLTCYLNGDTDAKDLRNIKPRLRVSGEVSSITVSNSSSTTAQELYVFKVVPFGTVNVGDGSATVGFNAKVKVSSNDSTPGYLNGKLVAGTGITLTEGADGGNETLTITSTGGGGGGEVNTASNVGTAGVGVFKQKVGADLQFKKINAGSSKVSITDDVGNDEVDIDIVPGNINTADLNNDAGFITSSSTDTLTNKTIDSFTNSVHSDTIHLQIRNETGGAITKGQLVYISGYSVGQDLPLVTLTDASSSSSMPAIGMVNETTIANNGNGEIIVNGKVTGIDTSGFTAGDSAYVSTTAGALSVRPTGATDQVQKIGEILRSHATLGVIDIRGAARSNDTPNLADGNLWIGNGSNAATAVTVSGDISISNTGTSAISSGVIVDADVNSSAAIAASKSEGAKISGSTYSTVQHFQDIFHSAGSTSGGAINDAGSGNITVDAGTGLLRASDSQVAQLLFMDWSALGSTAIPANTTRWVGVEYNAGSPQVTIRTSDDFNRNTDFILGTVVNEAGTLHVETSPHSVGDHANYMIQRSYETMGIQRDNITGGLALGETGTRNITLTTGNLWDRLTKFTIAALDTSASDSFDRYYSDGVGGFTREVAQTQWNNTQYDDGSGTLATLSNNRWGVQWFYIELDGTLTSMYGTSNESSKGAAETEAAPVLTPDRITVQSTLVGRLIFQKSASTATFESVFTTTFGSALISDHGNLSGLSDDDHAQYSLISSQAGVPSSTPGRVGEVNIDTTNDRFYIATDTASSADWDIGLTPGSTDTLTNKTIDANGAGNSISNIDVADLANGTDGELITWDAAGAPATVAVGTSGHVLTSNGVGAAPTFQATGDVVGPGSSTDNAIVRFDSTTGKLIQNSGCTIDDSNNMTVAGDIQCNETIYFDAEFDNGNSGTADTIDWGVGNKQKSTLTGNVTYTFTAPSGPCNVILKIVQDATGGRTVTFPATVKWAGGTAPTITATASATDIVSFYYDGTNYFGNVSQNFS